MSFAAASAQARIRRIETTNDRISGRGGLSWILRYVENVHFYSVVQKVFGSLKISGKGLTLFQFIKQLLAYFIDGTEMSMRSFDRRKLDEAYTAVLENLQTEMASSHQMKRFFRKFLLIGNRPYRKVLHELFLWRLKIKQPKVIKLSADTMPLNNDDADQREGVEPTYKKFKGYQPLHICWGPFLIDVIFRSGNQHSNHGKDFIKTMTKLVKLIREHYRAEVPIIIVTDSGFLDDKNFRYFEERLKISYICSGKLYGDIKDYLDQISYSQYKRYTNKKQIWHYFEFGNRLKSWQRIRRCIFTTLETEENGQFILEFERPDAIIYTNLGQDPQLTAQLIQAGGEQYLQIEKIIALAHQRGKDELIHRSLKEFATKEQLPFEKMGMNRAYYYFLVFSHFLYEAYKQDVLKDIIPITIYPNTFRRQFIDFAVKIVTCGRQVILKATQSAYDRLSLAELWRRCEFPEPIAIFAPR